MAITRKKITNPAIQELLQTQEQFHKAMQRFIGIYTTIANDNTSVLNESDRVRLNQFLKPYTQLSNNPFKDFKQDATTEDQVRQLDDIMRGQVRRLEQFYEQSSRQYKTFLQFIIDKKIKTVKDERGQDYDAASQLIKPTQNLMRYKLLIDEARKPANLGYQKSDSGYENDSAYQILTNLSIMMDGDVKKISQRAAGTDEVKKVAHGMDKLTAVAKQQRLREVIKKPQKVRVSAQSLFAKPKGAPLEPEPLAPTPKKHKPA